MSESNEYQSEEFDGEQDYKDDNQQKEYDEDEDLKNSFPESATEFYYAIPDDYIKMMRRQWLNSCIGSSYQNFEDVRSFFHEMGFRPSYEDIHYYIRSYDRPEMHARHKDQDDDSSFVPSVLSFAAFTDIVKAYMQDNDREVLSSALSKAFRVFDNEQEGYVNTIMLSNYLTRQPEIAGRKDYVTEFIREMDENGEGYISYETFISGFCDMFYDGLRQNKESMGIVTQHTQTHSSLKEAWSKQHVVDEVDDKEVDVEAILRTRIKELAKQRAEERKQKRRELRLAREAEEANIDSLAEEKGISLEQARAEYMLKKEEEALAEKQALAQAAAEVEAEASAPEADEVFATEEVVGLELDFDKGKKRVSLFDPQDEEQLLADIANLTVRAAEKSGTSEELTEEKKKKKTKRERMKARLKKKSEFDEE